MKRLYEKYETDYRINSVNQDYDLQDKVRDQYNYACQHLEMLQSISQN